MQFGLCEEGCVVGLLVLHGLDVSTQGFVGLTYWELLDCCLGAIRIVNADKITKLTPCRTGAPIAENNQCLRWY
jgi:hypothetical protein